MMALANPSLDHRGDRTMAEHPTSPRDAPPKDAAAGRNQPDRSREGGLIQVLSEDFQQLADRSQDAIYRLDIESQTFPFFNRRFLELFGTLENGAAALSLKGSLACIHPEDREPFKRERERSLQGGSRGGENEYRHLSPDGTVRWMHDKWTVIRDESGQPTAVEGFIRDDTRRKQAEDELERSRRNALIGSYIVKEGRFVYVNPEFCRITERDPDELIGSHSIQYVHEGFVGFVKEHSRAMLKGERSEPYAFCIVARSGAVKWVMETVTSIHHEGRRAILGFFMDVTRIRQATEERKEREKLQAVLELAGAVGHELNNPLQVVVTCSDKLNPEALADEASRQKLRLLQKNVQRIVLILKKFQNITQYATKDYVQGKKIFDLDAATGKPPLP
jgi:PAS domain S-box-containing protein